MYISNKVIKSVPVSDGLFPLNAGTPIGMDENGLAVEANGSTAIGLAIENVAEKPLTGMIYIAVAGTVFVDEAQEAYGDEYEQACIDALDDISFVGATSSGGSGGGDGGGANALKYIEITFDDENRIYTSDMTAEEFAALDKPNVYLVCTDNGKIYRPIYYYNDDIGDEYIIWVSEVITAYNGDPDYDEYSEVATDIVLAALKLVEEYEGDGIAFTFVDNVINGIPLAQKYNYGINAAKYLQTPALTIYPNNGGSGYMIAVRDITNAGKYGGGTYEYSPIVEVDTSFPTLRQSFLDETVAASLLAMFEFEAVSCIAVDYSVLEALEGNGGMNLPHGSYNLPLLYLSGNSSNMTAAFSRFIPEMGAGVYGYVVEVDISAWDSGNIVVGGTAKIVSDTTY